MSKLPRRVGVLLFVMLFALSPLLASGAQDKDGSSGASGGVKPVSDEPATELKVSKDFVGNADPNEKVDIVIELESQSVAELYTEVKATQGPAAAGKEDYQVAHAAQLKQAQAPVVAAANQVGSVVGQMTVLANGVVVTGVARRDLAGLYNLPGVKEVHIVPNYELDLHTSVPFIGGEQVRQTMGLDGRNTSVAIIDTGVDYTHRDFGGPGTVEAYTFATTGGRNTTVGESFGGHPLFPTQKVPGGYDFIGSNWVPGQPLQPDPDPIDDGPQGGHGTHVAGIAAGMGVPNNSVNGSIPLDFVSDPASATVYHGVAPAARIYAYKVCSSRSSSCSGTAMLQAMERSADPNQNGSTLDHVDVINMSIGSTFSGNPLTHEAANNAVDVGIAVAISAGNSGDVPFVTGSPSTAEKVLSVASSYAEGETANGVQVTYPSRTDTYLAVEGAITRPLSESGPVTGPVKYGDTAARRLGCNVSGASPYPSNYFAGHIALIDRGTCTFAEKILNAQAAGATAVIMVNTTTCAFPIAMGGSPTGIDIPGVMIRFEDGATIKSALAAGQPVTARLSTDITIPLPFLTDALSDFTSRGPSARGALKPDLTAPGSNIYSAAMGTGTAGVNNSGTSMAAPHIAGSLALMKQLHPTWEPRLLEAALVNSAKRPLFVADACGNIRTAEVSRTGSGRVDLVRAAQLGTTLTAEDLASVNFGIQGIPDVLTSTRVISVTNHSDVTKNYAISARTQFTQPSGVTLSVEPAALTIAGGQVDTTTLTIRIDSRALPEFGLVGPGSNGIANLNRSEIGGYVEASDGSQTSHLAWYVLPRRASEGEVSDDTLTYATGVNARSFNITNSAPYTATASILHLLGSDFRETVISESHLLPFDLKYVGARPMTTTITVSGSPVVTDVLDFGFHTYEARTLPLSGEFSAYVDRNQDGTADWRIFNGDFGLYTGAGFSGDNRVLVENLSVPVTATNRLATSGFFSDTGIATSNVINRVRVAQLGMTAGQPFNVYFESLTNTEDPFEEVDRVPNSGWVTFDPDDATYTPSTYSATVPEGGSVTVNISIDPSADSDDLGLLVLYRANQTVGPEADEVRLCSMNFSDVPSTDTFYHYIEYIYCRGVVTGYADGTFRTYNNTTRGQMMKMIVLALGLPITTPTTPTFSDVPPNHTFYQYIETGVALGIIGGYEDGTFRPQNNVTRGQLSKIVVLAAGFELEDPTEPTFSDVDRNNPFYTYVETIVKREIVGGYADGTFRWFNPATRGQIAKIVNLTVVNR